MENENTEEKSPEEKQAEAGLEYYFEHLLSHRQVAVRTKITVLFKHYKILRNLILEIFDLEMKQLKTKTSEEWDEWAEGVAQALTIWKRK